MTSVAVGIPWRGGCPVRERNMAYVRARIMQALPGVPVELVDSAGVRFSRAGARNAVMHRFVHADVVVIHDACEVTEPEGLTEAVTGAAGDGKLWQPFTLNYGWNEDQTEHLIKGVQPEGDPDLWGYGAPGGIWVMSPDAWWTAGGMDERCEGWGGEDDIFMTCARATVGAARTGHSAWHLWHPREKADYQNWDHRNAGHALSLRYADAARSGPAALQSMIAENRAFQAAQRIRQNT